jgi:hypothetical protein
VNGRRTIGDRRTLARALGKVALAVARAPRPAPVPAGGPAFLHGGVPERMAALLDGPPPARAPRLFAAVGMAVVAAMTLAAVHASADCFALLRR